MLDENFELLKPEASNNVVSSSDAICFIIISCVIMVLQAYIHIYIHTYTLLSIPEKGFSA